MKYQHDMMHCSQKKCKKKDTCYRYWLGEHLKGSGWQFASFYYPQKPITEGCEHYIEITKHEKN